MNPYTRSGDKVLNLRGAWADATHHSLLTTTRDFFDEKSFRDIRSHLSDFKTAQPEAHGIIAKAAREGSPISEKNRETLNAALKGHPLEQDWKNSQRGVITISNWTQKNGNAVPAPLLNVAGRAVLPNELAQDVERFKAFQANNPEQGALAAAFLASGQITPPQDRPTLHAMHRAGLLNGADHLSLQGMAVAESLQLRPPSR